MGSMGMEAICFQIGLAYVRKTRWHSCWSSIIYVQTFISKL